MNLKRGITPRITDTNRQHNDHDIGYEYFYHYFLILLPQLPHLRRLGVAIRSLDVEVVLRRTRCLRLFAGFLVGSTFT
jgi:hypothetical protein